MLMRGSAEHKNHNPILHFTSALIIIFHKTVVFFVYKLSGVGLQVLPFIDNRLLWSFISSLLAKFLFNLTLYNIRPDAFTDGIHGYTYMIEYHHIRCILSY